MVPIIYFIAPWTTMFKAAVKIVDQIIASPVEVVLWSNPLLAAVLGICFFKWAYMTSDSASKAKLNTSDLKKSRSLT